ncbi:MAG TPA: M23 family metallopeptidase [Spirochaetales bacterium]|nr:M23 family metallopeptidase [Spirochaetales bacterium]
MQTVIADQYIARRRKPIRISVDRGFSHSLADGRIAMKPARRESRPVTLEPSEPSWRQSIGRRAKARPNQPGGRVAKRVAVIDSISGLVEALASPRVATPIAGIAGAIALMVAIAAVGAFGRPADLTSFVLPDDGSSAAILLDALSPAADYGADSIPTPELPMTLRIATYTVAKNDTLDAISRRYGLRMDTLISVNGLGDARRIISGSTLKVPNLDGVVHTVTKGESLAGIAAAKGVSVLDIVDANDLASQTILPGQSLFIPGARLSSYDLKKALGQLVIWPINGRISSNFGYRPNPFTGVRQFHNGLDIVGPLNATVKAAMDGKVAETGYSAVFGNFVILSHPEGYQTLYAHLNKISVKAGVSIAQGSPVGLLGSTGYSTGPHLHFGVFKRGAPLDPLKLLKGG